MLYQTEYTTRDNIEKALGYEDWLKEQYQLAKEEREFYKRQEPLLWSCQPCCFPGDCCEYIKENAIPKIAFH